MRIGAAICFITPDARTAPLHASARHAPSCASISRRCCSLSPGSSSRWRCCSCDESTNTIPTIAFRMVVVVAAHEYAAGRPADQHEGRLQARQRSPACADRPTRSRLASADRRGRSIPCRRGRSCTRVRTWRGRFARVATPRSCRRVRSPAARWRNLRRYSRDAAICLRCRRARRAWENASRRSKRRAIDTPRRRHPAEPAELRGIAALCRRASFEGTVFRIRNGTNMTSRVHS